MKPSLTLSGYRRKPWIPTEEEVNLLIGGMGRKMAAFLQRLKETGARAGEAWNLRWIDLDTERKIVNVTAEKNSRNGDKTA